MKKFILALIKVLTFTKDNGFIPIKKNRKIGPLVDGPTEKIYWSRENDFNGISHTNFELKEWFVEIGEYVTYGDVICAIQNKSTHMELETAITGQVKYLLPPQKILQDICIAEITIINNKTSIAN